LARKVSGRTMAAEALTTPLMEQYRAVCARYPGHLVLFRVGDFYETFGEDAKLLSRELEVVLTARSADAKGERTPMAGVPHHAVESYLGRLVRKGYRVALCDQVEDARFAKGLVKREVTRVVTPGTVLEDRILPGPEHNFLATVEVPAAGPGAWAAVDITTGELFGGVVEAGGALALLRDLAAFSPREILVPAEATGGERGADRLLASEFPGARIDVAPPPRPAEAWPPMISAAAGSLAPPERAAVGRLVAYLEGTQPRLVPFLEPVGRAPGDRRMRLDAKTLRHLEITRPMDPDEASAPTLLSSWDETVTGPGRRTLSFWLRNPLADRAAIVARQDAVEALRALGPGLDRPREVLRHVADLSRIAARLAGRRVRPPELGALRSSLAALGELAKVLPGDAPALAALQERLAPPRELVATLERALPEEMPATVEAGGLFRPGYRPELDAAWEAARSAERDVEELERREAASTGIKSLKIGYNQVFGYYFEVTRPHLARVPAHFHRKQTLSGVERYTSPELTEIEARLLGARDRGREAERELWEGFLRELEPEIPRLHRLARAVGELDVLLLFGRAARDRGLVRPIVDDSTVLQIRDGRHPVLDRTLHESYVPNDTELDGEGARLVVLTGPNMSGKSTYMRQVGLLVVLAQVGSFVPARFARIGLVSSLFTRMGFTDEIARGKSSFMVEMTEVAEILRSADARSLVLLDEVGRGTSTFDGLAIAWATLREIHDRLRCRTLLATHYHQLTELIASLSGAQNAHLAVREDGDDVVFLHRLVPGSTDRSYGLHVARLAGLPPTLLKEAEQLLRRLEAGGIPLAPGGRGKPAPVRYTQAILLSEDRREAPVPPDELRRALAALDPDRLTPLEALRWVTEWRSRLAPPPAAEPP
jgi:DNA mismatch repair protein MutS